MGDELLEEYEFLSMVERDEERRRKEVRMLEKEEEMDWKRVEGILNGVESVVERRVVRRFRKRVCLGGKSVKM